MHDLSGKVAVVTGASTGIGFALAEALGKQGMRVMLAGKSGQARHGRRALARHGYHRGARAV